MEEVFPKSILVFGLTVRDTVLSAWVTMALIIIGAWLLSRYAPSVLEVAYAFLRDMVASSIGALDPEPYVPFLGTLAIYLLVANNISIVPVLQSPTKDINTTVALALVVLVAVYYFGFRRKGVVGYLRELASPMFVLDVIGQASRTLSLSLRLFGNIIAGEIIVAVIYRLAKPVAPLPMVALGLVTGVLQAYVFVILATGAIASAVRPTDT
ncbi:MAG: F0F1 ATP synthase subunit A [Anaerolineae bacterium]|jgi:F-type H+-transporting ATPase subunit a|nr:F0F1 ATP synthase subunit A [Anaerolineae bacterium]